MVDLPHCSRPAFVKWRYLIRHSESRVMPIPDFGFVRVLHSISHMITFQCDSYSQPGLPFASGVPRLK